MKTFKWELAWFAVDVSLVVINLWNLIWFARTPGSTISCLACVGLGFWLASERYKSLLWFVRDDDGPV